MKKGSGELTKWSKIAPPSGQPPEALYETWSFFHSFPSSGTPVVQSYWSLILGAEEILCMNEYGWKRLTSKDFLGLCLRTQNRWGKSLWLMSAENVFWTGRITNPEKGAFARGASAQICCKLRAKFAQHCRYVVSYIRGRVRKLVPNLPRIWKSISDNFMQIPLFQCPRFQISDRTDLVQFKSGFEKGTFKRQLCFSLWQFCLWKVLCLKDRSCLQNNHFLPAKRPLSLSLSAPNHKSQIASDLKSRSPNRKNFPPKSQSQSAQIALSNRAICDLNLCSNRR